MSRPQFDTTSIYEYTMNFYNVLVSGYQNNMLNIRFTIISGGHVSKMIRLKENAYIVLICKICY